MLKESAPCRFYRLTMCMGPSKATYVMQSAHMHDVQLQGTSPWDMQPCIAELGSSVRVSCRGVASLAYAAGAGRNGLLYSVGADCNVCALDAASGAEVMKFRAGSHALSCVGATPGCQSVLVGSSSLALWSVVRQKRLAKFMGHTVGPSLFRALLM